MLNKTTGRAESMWAAIAVGIFWASVITFLGAVILGKLVDREIIPMDAVGYGALITMLLSGWTASVCAGSVRHENRIVSSVLGAMGYFALLLIVNALFFGGKYPGLLAGVIVTMLGAGAGIVMKGKGRDKRIRRRYKIPHA